MSKPNTEEINRIMSEAFDSAKGRSKIAEILSQNIRERMGLTHRCSTCGEFINYEKNECCSVERILRK
jgi:hypothetical protein